MPMPLVARDADHLTVGELNLFWILARECLRGEDNSTPLSAGGRSMIDRLDQVCRSVKVSDPIVDQFEDGTLNASTTFHGQI